MDTECQKCIEKEQRIKELEMESYNAQAHLCALDQIGELKRKLDRDQEIALSAMQTRDELRNECQKLQNKVVLLNELVSELKNQVDIVQEGKTIVEKRWDASVQEYTLLKAKYDNLRHGIADLLVKE